MRRKDREVVDNAKINQIIKNCQICRLGLNDNGRVYIVPLNFGYEELAPDTSQIELENSQAPKSAARKIFYFHGAKEGRKAELIKKTHYAAFELDTNYELKQGPLPCSFSAKFQSVIGEGEIDFVEDAEEKIHALNCIMKQAAGKAGWVFPKAMLNAVAVFKLEVKEIFAKENV